MNFFKIATVFIIITLTMTSCITINTPGSEIIELDTLGSNTKAEAEIEETQDTATELISEETEPEITKSQTSVTEQTPVLEETEKATESSSAKACIELVSLTSPISNNNTATISIKGKPSTEYDINVRYATTVSSANGLENKTSDQNGVVSWSWKIGASVKSGSYKITITDGTEVFETQIQVN